ncbi:MAG TPA: FtsW/RodA/SpoVE family cell cycle protein [Chloroflexia bacterium]|nr:FtsW/RodA/SpoVE family cell cycle protein [Chloroflexia bacterium]
MSVASPVTTHTPPAPGVPAVQPGPSRARQFWGTVRGLRWTEFRLLLIPSILSIVGMLMVILVPTGAMQWQWKDLWMSFVFIGLLAGLHLYLNVFKPRADQVLLPITATIMVLGLVMIQRLEPALVVKYEEFAGIARKQVLWIVVGMFAMWATVALVRDLNWLRRYKYTFAILGIGLVAATLVFGTDAGSGSGVKLWFDFGFFLFQPSELLKVVLVIFLAGYLDDKRELLASPYRLGPVKLPPIPYIAPLLVLWALALVLFVVQRDLGSALLFFGIFLAMLYVASGRLFFVVGGLALFFAAAYTLSAFFASQFTHIARRVSIWLDPWPVGHAEGYQIVQSLYALASGGVLGVGIGFGSSGIIPAVQTDMIISAIGEELGLAGTLGVVALFMVLVYRGYHIAFASRSGYEQLLAVGLTTILGLQAIIIIGGAIKMIPLTGITLPFISYGGSSLITNCIIIGLLLRVSAPRPVRTDTERLGAP